MRIYLSIFFIVISFNSIWPETMNFKGLMISIPSSWKISKFTIEKQDGFQASSPDNDLLFTITSFPYFRPSNVQSLKFKETLKKSIEENNGIDVTVTNWIDIDNRKTILCSFTQKNTGLISKTIVLADQSKQISISFYSLTDPLNDLRVKNIIESLRFEDGHGGPDLPDPTMVGRIIGSISFFLILIGAAFFFFRSIKKISTRTTHN